MLYTEMRTFFSGNYTKHVNIKYGQNGEILTLNNYTLITNLMH